MLFIQLIYHDLRGRLLPALFLFGFSPEGLQSVQLGLFVLKGFRVHVSLSREPAVGVKLFVQGLCPFPFGFLHG